MPQLLSNRANREYQSTTEQDEWVDVDGMGHGHSVYSHHQREGTGSNSAVYVTHWNPQTFLSQFEGGWNTQSNPIVAYAWTPVVSGSGPFNESKDSAYWSMPVGNRYTYSSFPPFTSEVWYGSASTPITNAYSYTATDSTGATGTAKYILTLHDPFEAKTHDIASIFDNPQRASGNILGPCSAQTGQTTQVSISLTADAGGAIGAWLADIFSIDVSASVNYSESTSILVGGNVPAGKYTWLEQLDHYYYHTGLADKYDTTGYLGEFPYSIKQIPPTHLDQYGIQLHRPFEDYSNGPPPGP